MKGPVVTGPGASQHGIPGIHWRSIRRHSIFRRSIPRHSIHGHIS
jgi:hypothetical protein